MKRIVSLLLILTLVFALASCAPAGADLSKYQNAIDATSPAKVTISTKLNADDVELLGSYEIVYADGVANITYQYEELTLLGDNIKETVGPITTTLSPDGTATGVNGNITSAAKLNVKLDAAKMKSFIEAKGILTCEILAANTASVLGFSTGADTSLELRLTADGKIGSASINYTTGEGYLSSVIITFE